MRSFGREDNAAYELTSTYTPAGRLQSQHLNSLVYDRDYGWNDNGDLVRISGPWQSREYGYSATGRLESVRTLASDLDIRIPYASDPAETACRPRSCTRTVHRRRGRITESPKTRTTCTATTGTAG
ncbi:hypothetical protein ACLK2F_02935 [Escherichia coli]